jgi:peptidoglycan hydrolase-like protein with peptidoglycan-binding domain
MDKNAAWAAAQKSAGAPAQHTSGTGGKPVQTKPTTAAPTHAASAAKSDPAVVKIQQDLIAKGYPIKADGIMGPKTQQAMDWQAQSDKRDAGLKATNNMDPSKPAPAVPTDPAQKAAYDAAVKNMDPNQTPAPAAAPAGAAAITPAFQSQQTPAPEKPEGVTVFPGTVTQQTAAQPSSEWDQNDPDTPAMFRNPLPGEPGMHESVSFENEDSLARIVQLARW